MEGREVKVREKKEIKMQPLTFLFSPYVKTGITRKSIVALEYLMMIAKREMDISNMKTVVVITW